MEIAEGTRNAAIEGATKSLNDQDIIFEREKKLYNDKVIAFNKLNKEIEDIDEQNKRYSEQANKSKDDNEKLRLRNLIINNNKINDAKKNQRDKDKEDLDKTLKNLDDLLAKKADLEKKLTEAIASGANIDDLKTKILEINDEIVKNSADASQNVQDLWTDAMEKIGAAVGEVGKVFSGLSNISDLMMTTIDNRTDHEKNQLQLSDAYNKASSDKQAKMIYDLDKKNYDSKKKLFDLKKAFDIGVVATDAASAEMGAVKNLIGNGGAISPIAWGIFIAETALIASTAVASIAEISSRQLEAPIPPKSGNADTSGVSAVNIALNPSKTALTSNQENLNMMNASSNSSNQQSIVKVSDINKVQKQVEVRESNSTY